MSTLNRDKEGKYTEEFKASLKRGRKDIKEGRVTSLEEVKKEIIR